MTSLSSSEALVALNLLPGIGPVRVRRLMDALGSAEAILSASTETLRRVEGIGPETAKLLRAWESQVDVTKELSEVRDRGLHVVTLADEDYPEPLRDAYDPPLVLYVWGNLLERDRHALSIVGSRRTTNYGRQVTKKLSFQLAHAGFTIISGLARGIDTTAHEAAIAANGRTIAVLGSGLAKLYPAENLPLAEKIADGNGAVVTEFPLHWPPDKQTFPLRNRIVAAWARAVIVTECAARSGSLITANLAADTGKPVFAVPGPIDRESSMGCNQLIRNGATLITDGNDVLDDLGNLPLSPTKLNEPATAPAPPELAGDEAKVFAALGPDETSIDQLIDTTGLPAGTVTATLLKLEFRRLVQSLPGFRYTKRP